MQQQRQRVQQQTESSQMTQDSQMSQSTQKLKQTEEQRKQLRGNYRDLMRKIDCIDNIC
jgi:hypothetical protein